MTTKTKIVITALALLVIGGAASGPAANAQIIESCEPGYVKVRTEPNGDLVCEKIEERGRAKVEETAVESVSSLRILLANIVGWVQVFFYIVATLMIILAAWNYLTSGGSEEKVTSAKNKVIYALVAIAIAVIAGGVVTLVRTFVN